MGNDWTRFAFYNTTFDIQNISVDTDGGIEEVYDREAENFRNPQRSTALRRMSLIGGDAVMLFSMSYSGNGVYEPDADRWASDGEAFFMVESRIRIRRVVGGVDIRTYRSRGVSVSVTDAVGIRQRFVATNAVGWRKKGVTTASILSLSGAMGTYEQWPTSYSLGSSPGVFAKHSAFYVINARSYVRVAVEGPLWLRAAVFISNVSVYTPASNVTALANGTACTVCRLAFAGSVPVLVPATSSSGSWAEEAMAPVYNQSGAAKVRLGFGLILNATLTQQSRIVLSAVASDVVLFGGVLASGSSIETSLSRSSARLSDEEKRTGPAYYDAAYPDSGKDFSDDGFIAGYLQARTGNGQYGAATLGGGGGVFAESALVSVRTANCSEARSCLLMIDRCTIESRSAFDRGAVVVTRTALFGPAAMLLVWRSSFRVLNTSNLVIVSVGGAERDDESVAAVAGVFVVEDGRLASEWGGFRDGSQFAFLSSRAVTLNSSIPGLVFLAPVGADMSVEVWGSTFVGGSLSFSVATGLAAIIVVNNTFLLSAGLAVSGNSSAAFTPSQTFVAGCNRGSVVTFDVFGDGQVLCRLSDDQEYRVSSVAVTTALRCSRRLSFFAVDTPRAVSVLPSHSALSSRHFAYGDAFDEGGYGGGRVILPCHVTVSTPTVTPSVLLSPTPTAAITVTVTGTRTITASRSDASVTKASGATLSASATGPSPSPSVVRTATATAPQPPGVRTATATSAPSPSRTLHASPSVRASSSLEVTNTVSASESMGIMPTPTVRYLAPIPAAQGGPLGVAGKASQQAASAVGVIAAASSVGSVNGGQLGVANAVLRMASCGNGGDDVGEEETASDIPILVHPFRFSIGGRAGGPNASLDSAVAGYAGAAFSNTVIIPAILAVGALGPVGWVMGRLRKKPRKEVLTTLGWPSLLVLPFATLGEGIGVSVVRCLSAGSAASSADGSTSFDKATVLAMGSIGAAATLLFALLWLWAVVAVLPRDTLFLAVPKNRRTSADAEDTRVLSLAAVCIRVVRVVDGLMTPSRMWDILSPAVVAKRRRMRQKETRRSRVPTGSAVGVGDLEMALVGQHGDSATDGEFPSVASPPMHSRASPRIGPLRPVIRAVMACLNLQDTAFCIADARGSDDPSIIWSSSVYVPTPDILERYGGAIGEKRVHFAEFLSFACSVAVGVTEGIQPTTPTGCRMRAVAALLFAVVQCACSVTAMIPLELYLQVVMSIFIIPLCVVVVVKVWGEGGGGNNASIDDALSILSLGTNIVGMALMISSLVVAARNMLTASRQRLLALARKRAERKHRENYLRSGSGSASSSSGSESEAEGRQHESFATLSDFHSLSDPSSQSMVEDNDKDLVTMGLRSAVEQDTVSLAYAVREADDASRVDGTFQDVEEEAADSGAGAREESPVIRLPRRDVAQLPPTIPPPPWMTKVLDELEAYDEAKPKH